MGLFPETCSEALQADVYRLDVLIESKGAAAAEFRFCVIRVQFGPGGQPGVLPPVGLFPGTWREALRADAYRLDMLIEFYGDNFGITGHDSLEDKQSKFLEWIGAVRP